MTTTETEDVTPGFRCACQRSILDTAYKFDLTSLIVRLNRF